jgi:hypothetical protein
MVIDVVSINDERCGPYLAEIRNQIKLEEDLAKKTEAEALATQAAQREEYNRLTLQQQQVRDGLEAQQAVREIMKDPDSARFGEMTYKDNNNICLTVNGKNSMGGYTGDQEAYIERINGKLVAKFIIQVPKSLCMSQD